jgi:hypothetical protein
MVNRYVSRRRLLRAGAGLTAGAAALTRRQRTSAQPLLASEDLVDAGESFRRGEMHGATLAPGPAGPVIRAMDSAAVFTSVVMSATFPFTHVGLHWAATVPPAAGCEVSVRTSIDGAAWSPWRRVYVEAVPRETPAGEYFGSLVHARNARFVQYRIALTAGVAVPVVERVTASVIASQAAPMGTRLRTVTVDDPATGRSLAITPRELWLADETLRFNDEGGKVWAEMFVPARKLIVHHTATRNDYESVDEAAAEVRAIYHFHAVTRGWGDIAYTALIDKFGNLYEGRYGRGAGVSREMLSPAVVAGHDLYHNYGSAGVALVGDATSIDWPMLDTAGPMWDTLVRYCIFESGRSFLRPLAPGAARQRDDGDIAASDFLRSNNEWSDGMRNVSGHRETNDTTCPGDIVMDMLGDLRTAIHAGLAGGGSRTAVLLATAGREATVGEPITVRAEAETPEPGWQLVGFEYAIESWFKPPDGEDLGYLGGYTDEAQPRPLWHRIETTGAWIEVTFTPNAPGQYTFHARTLLQQGSGKNAIQRSSVYEGTHTYLVLPADTSDAPAPVTRTSHFYVRVSSEP